MFRRRSLWPSLHRKTCSGLHPNDGSIMALELSFLGRLISIIRVRTSPLKRCSRPVGAPIWPRSARLPSKTLMPACQVGHINFEYTLNGSPFDAIPMRPPPTSVIVNSFPKTASPLKKSCFLRSPPIPGCQDQSGECFSTAPLTTEIFLSSSGMLSGFVRDIVFLNFGGEI